jgi:peptide-methionine (S)-S-oxide reductase
MCRNKCCSPRSKQTIVMYEDVHQMGTWRKKMKFSRFTFFAVVCAVFAFFSSAHVYSSSTQIRPEKNMSENSNSRTGLAILGGGCFWCIEAVFETIDGVKAVTSGYAGGTKENPTYKEVCSGKTGHAEVVQIEYDPENISYEEILDIFWKAHDPTTLNRQGADVGSQYRSIILFHNEKQKEIAEISKQKLQDSGYYSDPVVTEIQPLSKFYPAEEYHQDYYAKNPYAGYCSIVIRPKLQKLGLE